MIHSSFQGANESFYDVGSRITSSRKIMNIFLFHWVLKCAIVKFFSIIRLKRLWFSTISASQYLSKDFRECHARLDLMGCTHENFDKTSTTSRRYLFPLMYFATFVLRTDRLHSNLADQDLIYLKVSFVNKDLKHQVQAVIKRAGLRNNRVHYMNGRHHQKKSRAALPTARHVLVWLSQTNAWRNTHKSKISCSFCEKVYIGEPGRTIDSRIKEHLRMTKHSIV